MQIFKQEIEDGLEAKVAASASINYAAFAQPCDKNTKNAMKHIKSLASLNDSDLYYVQSILVSSSWNKNDDIFDKTEVWLAKNTPEDKPTNLEHDENLIIGHITSNWPITEDGILIDANTPMENLPEKYHILTGSVIYKAFSSPELKDRSDKLIAEIENGQKYVSMECFFKGFDYGVQDKSSGEYKVLARNEETAYLTKYLRAYGGLGEHDNYKIGRVLRNITFSGKGFVDRPANPDSIIFKKNIFSESPENISDEKIEDLSISGVSNNQSTSNVENHTMSLEKEVVEAAEVVAEQLTENTKELEATVLAKEEEIAKLKAELDLLKSEKEEAAKKVKEDENSKDEENKNLKAALEVANETIAGYKMKEEEMAKKEKKMKRVASLVEVGVDAETATSTVEKFESLDDEAFYAMTSLFAGKMPPWLEKIKKGDDEEDTKTKEKKKASEEITDPSILETAEVEETVNLSVGGETAESAIEATRADLVAFVYSRLGKKL
jgi:hypothetical protein